MIIVGINSVEIENVKICSNGLCHNIMLCVIMCNNKCQTVTHYTSLHFKGLGTSPQPRNSRSTSCSSLQVVVVAMGSVATAIAMTEWMVPVFPAKTTGSLQRMEVMVKCTLPPFQEMSCRWASNSTWYSISGKYTWLNYCDVCSNM